MLNKKDLYIRPMREEDLNDLAVLYTDVYSKIDIGEKWTKESSYKLMEYWLSKQPDLSFVALIKNKIVGGFVAGIKPWWDGNHLVDGEIFVDHNYQRCGLGTELSKVMYKTAIDIYKIISIDLITYSRNGFPLSWHKSNGFKVNEELFLINGFATEVLKKLGK